ncbi:acyltransferase family protein [Rufibacter sediminis]|uniref:Acyltransferase n=2 Tax=Rufibacter sediminis TaxID=2762756 RepID=A0ABR6VPU3_9BACT|nr:acyltransferase [Rufibacter sediminis]MBC3539221.1 acyltransferase [Rufibacter sediminis]
MKPAAPSAHYFPALTGLRAAAAFLVYAHHAKPTVPFASDFFRLLFQEAHIGVSVFFVLSGFLISVRYSHSFQQKGGSNWVSYAWQRFARLYPVYFLCTLAALFFRHDFRPDSWILNLLMLQGLFPQFSFTGVGVGWSMTVEVFFYASAPLVLLYGKRLGLLKSTAVTLLLGVLLLAIGQLPLPYEFVPDWNFLIRSTFFGRCFEFYLGIWLARHFLLPPTSAPMKLRPGLLTYGGALGIVACMLGMAYLNRLAPSSPVLFHGLNNVVLPFFIGGLLLGLTREKTWFSQALGSRVGQELGKGSYLFYLVHYTFGFDILYFHVWPNKGGVLLLLAVLSVAGYHLLEAPLQKLVLKWQPSRPISETKSA